MNSGSYSIGQEGAAILDSGTKSYEDFVGNSVFVFNLYRQAANEDFFFWKDIWKRDTAHLSSISAIVDNMAYQEIIALGPVVVPFIIEELKAEIDHWFYALHQLTGANPIIPEHAGNLEQMRNDWLAWAAVNLE